MKRNNLFVTKRICNSLYLLPVGQMIADFGRGIKMNETALYVWEQLENDISLNDLLARCNSFFEAENDAEKELVKKDVTELLSLFKDRGMIEGSRNIFRCSCSICQNNGPLPSPEFENIAIDSIMPGDVIDKNFVEPYEKLVVGGLGVLIYGDRNYISSLFDIFRCEDEETSVFRDYMKIAIINIDSFDRNIQDDGYYDETKEIGDVPVSPESKSGNAETFRYESSERDETGIVIIHNNEVTVLEYSNRYILFFNGLDGIQELHLSKDGGEAVVYCTSPNDELKENLFYAIRIPFLIYALQKGRVMLHSCSILYNEKLWAFSAPSGTGKSTHCGLWNKLYGTPVINGDLNLIGMENGVPYVYGTPWCGTSGIADTKKYKLGGIVLLKQGPKNRLETLSNEQKILLVQQRLVTSVWDENMLDETLSIVSQIVSDIYVKRYYCTKEDDAATFLNADINRCVP